MKEIRVLEALGMAIEWDDPALSNATKAHVETVWAESPHGNATDQIPKYFRDFGGAKKADQTELTVAKNRR
eukprot:10992624-Ditylum_brightwellii.AAC.1